MSWFRRKKQSEADVVRIDGREMLNRYLLDTRIAESQQLSLLLGLTPFEDPDEEAFLSTERLQRMALMIPIIEGLNQGLAYSLVEYFKVHVEDYREMSDAQSATLAMMLEMVANGASVATLCQLEDIGLVNYVWSNK